MKPWRLLPIAGAVLLGFGPAALAATCTSVGSGLNWGTAATWTSAGNCNRVPLASDDVIIGNGHTITMNGNPGAALSLTINGTASWTQNNRTTNVGTGGITINGDITGSSNNDALTTAGTLTLNNVTLSTGSVTLTTQTTAGIAINGRGSVALLAVNAASTNNALLTVRTTLSGTNTLTNNATLNIGGTSTLSGLTANAVGNLVNYSGAAQAVKLPTAGYYDLTLSGSGLKTLPGSALAVARNLTLAGSVSASTAGGFSVGGNLTINSGCALTETGSATVSIGSNLQNDGSYTASTGVHSFSGVGMAFAGANPISIPSINISGSYQNNTTLTVATALAGAGTLANSASRTLNLGGSVGIASLVASAPGNGVTYNGAAQTIKGSSYQNLSLNGSGANPLGGDATVGGTLTLSSGTLVVGGNTLNLNGPPIAGAGAATNLITSSASSLVFGGSAGGVTLPASVTALKNLTLNNANGLTLGGSGATTTVGGTLTLGANRLSTATNTLSIAGNCSANGGNGSLSRIGGGYVIGNLQLAIPLTALSSACIYHLGDGTGYAPITLAVGTTSGGTLTGRVDAGDHPDTLTGSSGIDPARSANHYWTLTAGSLSPSVSYSASFQFCANPLACQIPGEIDSGADSGSFVVARKLGGSWATQGGGTLTGYSTQASGITNFGEFAVGNITLCYSDAFTGTNGSPPGSNWSVGSKGGSFGTPVIFGNRLRLTNASNGVATWATLLRPFPAAGNKVTVVFQHFAYGGSSPGADGIGMILSNAAVPPAVGAFGGSLGYAQKSNPGSDCTTPGGCPGFTGGWLGVGLDEYGNYSANTEGRYGGGAALVPQSVAVRGSGSGMSGYRFILGTGGLSPPVDGNAGASPPHQYRIIVDHSDNANVWTSVERDTSGGGSAYSTLVGCAPGQTSGCTALNLADPGYSQNAIPPYLELSLTGSTGASSNIHEIDNLSVCTVRGLAAPTLHHIEIDHGAYACTTTAASVNLKACADAACSTLYMNSVQVTLSSSAGTWSANPVTISGGQTTATLSDGTAGTVTLGATATSPAAANATQCFNGTTQSCSLSFAACSFDVIEVGAAAGTAIYTKLAGTAFNLDLLSLGGNQTVTAIELVDMSSGSCAAPHAVLAPLTLSPLLSAPGVANFSNANPRKTFSFTYSNAAPNVRVRVAKAGPAYSCSTDNFAIRPLSFSLALSPSGSPLLKAGTDPFTITATTLSAYSGTPKFSSSAIAAPGGQTRGQFTNLFLPASSGVATATGVYSEVGNFVLLSTPASSQFAVYDDNFAAVDSNKAQPECSSDFSNTANANGMFGCMFGNAAALTVARFIPDHFTTRTSEGCSTGIFTYSAQPFGVRVDALNAGGNNTLNYSNATGFSRAVTLVDSNGAAGSFGGSNSVPATAFAAGYALATPTFSFNLPLTAPATIKLRASDTDNVSSSGFAEGQAHIRSGRLRLFNAYGTDIATLRLAMLAQYWSGLSWVLNGEDSCTSIPLTAVALSGQTPPLNPGNMGSGRVVSAGVLANGSGAIVLQCPYGNCPLAAKPGVRLTGKVDLAINLGTSGADQSCLAAHGGVGAGLPWLRSQNGGCSPGFDRDPSARASFGIYAPEMRKTVHVRELF